MPTIVSADGTRLDVTSTGSGPGLVVIPGGLCRVQPRLAELIPHARYVLMPELDHSAPDESAPAAVADLVRAFLTTDDAEAR